MNWQIIVVVIVVAGALAYVGRELWRSIFTPTKTGCGSCKSCGSENETPRQKVLVTLEDGPADRRQ